MADLARAAGVGISTEDGVQNGRLTAETGASTAIPAGLASGSWTI